MNLFDLAAVLRLDSSEYEEGIRDAESKIKGLGSKIGTGLKVAGGVAAASVTAAGVAVGKLTKDSVSAYAQFEQLEGGVQKLFGEKASKQIMEYAENAYKTSGLSANQYMEQATSFSAALINSLGGDTEQAAKLADEAMKAMSDNVNTFGSDMSSVQYAFQGFAKGNYTMLDNLKLGYGGTKEEMQRLIEDAAKATEAQEKLGLSVDSSSMSFDNIVKAIQVAQYQQGIYGTTVNEAEKTISGSFAMMKASWGNLLTSFSRGSGETKKAMSIFIGNVKTVIKNVVPVVKTAMKGIGTAIKELVPAIQAELPGIVSDVLPSLIDSAVKLVAGIVQALPGLMQGIITTASAVVDSIGAAISARSPALGEAFNTVVSVITGAFKTVSTVVQEKVIPIFGTVIEYVTGTLLPRIQEAMPLIQGAISSAFEAIKTVWDTVLSPVFTAILDVVQNTVIPVLQERFEATKTVISNTFQTISNIWNESLLPVFQAIAAFVVEHILPTFETVWPQIQSLVSNAMVVISTVWNEVLSVAFEALKTVVVDVLLPIFEEVWPKIETVVTTAMNAIKDVWEQFLAPALAGVYMIVTQYIVPIFEENWPKVKDAVVNAFKAIGNFWNDKLSKVFKSIIDGALKIKDNFVEKFQAAKEAVSTAFTNIKEAWDGFKGRFDEIKQAVKDVQETFKEKFENIKKKVFNAFDKISSYWDNLSPVFDTIQGALATVGEVWDSTFGAMLTTVKNVWTGENGIKTTIDNALSTIKGLFNFEWKLPEPKLPSIDWDWVDGPLGISFPSFHIVWNARAYDNPWLFDSKGILGGYGFGDRGNYQGGEIVYSRDKLMQDIRKATGNSNKPPVTINVYQQPWQDAKELAREISEIISNDYEREGAAYA